MCRRARFEKAWRLSQRLPRHFSDTFARRQLKHLLNSYRFFPAGALVREGKFVIATRIIFFAHCQWIFAAGRLDDDEKVAQPRVCADSISESHLNHVPPVSRVLRKNDSSLVKGLTAWTLASI